MGLGPGGGWIREGGRIERGEVRGEGDGGMDRGKGGKGEDRER